MALTAKRVAADVTKGAVGHPALVFVCIGILFFVTNPHKDSRSIDTSSNIVMADHIGATGSPCVTDPSLTRLSADEYFGEVLWMRQGKTCVLNKYPVATVLPFVPAYFLWNNLVQSFDDAGTIEFEGLDDEIVTVRESPSEPATFMAAVLVALSGWMLFNAARNFGAVRELALAGSVAFLVSTPLWAVASTALWPHTSNVFYLSAALWAASSKKWWIVGLFCGLAIMSRPPAALIATGLGLGAGYSLRDWKPAFKVAAGSLGGVGTLLLWNYHYFGAANLSGGYGDNMTSKLVGSQGWGWYFQSVHLGLFHYKFGLFVITPAVALVIVAAARKWRSIDWVPLGAAVGGVLFILVQWRINRSSGGSNFYTYRYPIEMLVPLSVVATLVYKQLPKVAQRLLLVSVAIGFFVQVAAVAEYLPKYFDQAL